jgi:penicillin amidase
MYLLKNDEDAYFVQGYLHAKFRLWQMEFQAKAAAGRLSEILGAGKDQLS